MQKYLTHEPLARGYFNIEYNGKGPSTENWERELMNKPELLDLLCKRMESDYNGLHAQMRKAYNSNQIEPRTNQSSNFKQLDSMIVVNLAHGPFDV